MKDVEIKDSEMKNTKMQGAEIKEEAVYWLWLSGMEELSRSRLRKLLEYFGTPCDIYMAGDKDIMPFLPEPLKAGWNKKKDLDAVIRLKEKLEADKITFLYYGHPMYPEKFMQMPDAPFSLFLKGRLPGRGSKNIAIIGARNATVYGKELAGYFAKKLAQHGVGVISGLAAGIDGAGHRGALEGMGYTLGIIGGGIYSVYPRENYDLYRQLSVCGGIVSEYPPSASPMAYRFPERNRLISGISDGILVVEAREKSGTFITVDQGLEQGKNIYALPGRITDVNSRGCNRLIMEGARPVMDVEDILEELHLQAGSNDNFMDVMELTENSLAQAEKMVYSCLSLEPLYVDEIVKRTGMSVSDTLSVLLSLELKGVVRQVVNHFYIRVLGT